MLYLTVDGIDATVAHLTTAGVSFEQGAHRIHIDDAGSFGTPGTEDWKAFFRDSEGNLVGLVERRPPRRAHSARPRRVRTGTARIG